MLLAARRWRPGSLLIALLCPGQPPCSKRPDINSAELEKPYLEVPATLLLEGAYLASLIPPPAHASFNTRIDISPFLTVNRWTHSVPHF